MAQDDRFEGSPLLDAESSARYSEAANTRPMLQGRAGKAIMEAAHDGLRWVDIPFENVSGEVERLFVGDLEQRGYTASKLLDHDIGTVLRIKW